LQEVVHGEATLQIDLVNPSLPVKRLCHFLIFCAWSSHRSKVHN
jgi:hypothetical protein